MKIWHDLRCIGYDFAVEARGTSPQRLRLAPTGNRRALFHFKTADDKISSEQPRPEKMSSMTLVLKAHVNRLQQQGLVNSGGDRSWVVGLHLHLPKRSKHVCMMYG